MCKHDIKQVNNVRVCVKCGLTRTPDGRIMFDKKIVNFKYNRKGTGNGKNK